MRDIEQGLRFASPPAYVLGHAYGVIPASHHNIWHTTPQTSAALPSME